MSIFRIIWRGFLIAKRSVKNSIYNYYWFMTNVNSNVNHLKKNLESPGILTDKQKKMILDLYSKYRYYDTDAHEFYYQKTGFFSPYYIPDELYYREVDPYFSNRTMARYFDNKCFYRRLFPGIKQPESLLYRCNGFWFDGNDRLISEKEMTELLCACKNELFVKIATGSMGGHGVFYYQNGTDHFDEILLKIKDIPGDIVVQKAIKQHEALSQLNRSSVNTIRVLSFMRSNGVKVYSSIVRIGGKGSKVDNVSSGGMSVGINSDGSLKNVAYDSNGKKFEKYHPISGTEFSSIRIPNFEFVLDTVKRLHQYHPYFRLISWDIAIGEDKMPILIEANLYLGELDFHQLNNGPLFGEDTEENLNEVFHIH